MRTLLVWLAVVAIGVSEASAVAAGEAGAWSKPVNGLRARLSFAQKETVNGTPIIITYLELQNVSDLGNVMDVPDLDKVKFSVTDSTGKIIRPASVHYDEMRAQLGLIRLPYDSYLRFNVAHRGAGIPKDQAGLLDLGALSTWVFQRGDERAYYLQAKLTVKETKERRWWGTMQIPKAKLPVARTKR